MILIVLITYLRVMAEIATPLQFLVSSFSVIFSISVVRNGCEELEETIEIHPGGKEHYIIET